MMLTLYEAVPYMFDVLNEVCVCHVANFHLFETALYHDHLFQSIVRYVF